MVPLPLGFAKRSDHIPAGTNLRGKVSRQTGLAIKAHAVQSRPLSIASSADDNHSVPLVGVAHHTQGHFFWPQVRGQLASSHL
jgi:hypothetical protein